MAKIGIGIVGLDHWYWAYGSAYTIATHSSAHLVGVYDQKASKVEKMARLYGAKAYSQDYCELLENKAVDAVIITTTTRDHEQVAIDAALAGKHILVGKPASRTLSGADRIIDTARKEGVKLMAMAAGPGRGDIVLNLIKDGAIGKPYAAYSALWAIPPLCEPGMNEPGWFIDPSLAAGGGFIDHAVYAVGRIRRYMGSEVEQVYAEMGKYVFDTWPVEDHGIAILRFTDACIATIESTFTAPDRTHSRFKVIGTEGEIEVDGNQVKIWSKRAPYKNRTILELLPANPVLDKSFAEISIPIPPFIDSYKGTVNDFIQFILTDQKPFCTPEDARTNLEVCLAAYESVRTHSAVSLPLKGDVNVEAILRELPKKIV